MKRDRWHQRTPANVIFQQHCGQDYSTIGGIGGAVYDINTSEPSKHTLLFFFCGCQVDFF